MKVYLNVFLVVRGYGIQTYGLSVCLGLPGPSCSKLTISLVNVSLKFQTLIAEILQNFC